MNDRRAQWLRFYEAALSGASVDTAGVFSSESVAERAAEIADAAMARLDARTFPPTNVEALMKAAAVAWANAENHERGRLVHNHHMAALGKALADLKEQT